MAEEPVKPEFDSARRDAKRAQWALNGLVIFSAIAGAFFFVYVLHTIGPFGSRNGSNVEVPTSAAGARYGLLFGTDQASGISAALRDIDEAPAYRDRLSDTMRAQLGIGQAGRLYILEIRNDGEAAADFSIQQLDIVDNKGGKWTVSWLDQAASAQTAGPTGRLRIAQSERKFELVKGAQRLLYVFIAGAAPPAEEFSSGLLKLANGQQLSLSHTETKAQ